MCADPLPSFRRVAAALFAIASVLATAPTAAMDRHALVESLRGGGYILYFRHAPTDWLDADQFDSEAVLSSCDRGRMRQLSEQGRNTARALGEAIRRLEIPVSAVYASEYCRTTETAKLLGLGPVETTRDILNVSAAGYVGGVDALAAAARKRLSTPPPAGSNVVLVAHGNVLMLVAKIRPPEAGAAVVRPQGDGRFEVLGILSPEDWVELAGAKSSR